MTRPSGELLTKLIEFIQKESDDHATQIEAASDLLAALIVRCGVHPGLMIAKLQESYNIAYRGAQRVRQEMQRHDQIEKTIADAATARQAVNDILQTYGIKSSNDDEEVQK